MNCKRLSCPEVRIVNSLDIVVIRTALCWFVALPAISNAQKPSENYFAPNHNHSFLADQIEPSLHYENGDVSEWQEIGLQRLSTLLGDFPKERTPLSVRSIWKKDHEFGTIEKIVFTSEPFADVPAYVCLPNHSKPPYTFVICIQGHSTGMHNSIGYDYHEVKNVEAVGDRDYAIQCMKRGLAALCIEQRGFGQRRNRVDIEKDHRTSCNSATMRALMVGRTIHGERIYDVDRAIDYLATRKDVHMNTIGIMGNSTGGSMSIYAAAMLPRIKWAMPSCGFVKYRTTQMEIPCCVCSFIPSVYKFFDKSDVAGLIAPRPLVIVTASNDRLQSIQATEDAFKHVRKIYKAAGVADNCQLVVGDDGHRFYADLAFPVILRMIEALKQG